LGGSGGARLAGVVEGAGSAFGLLVDRRGKLLGLEELEESPGTSGHQFPESVGKDHLGSAAGFSVKEEADRDAHREGFFQADGLGAKLHLIGLVGFGFPAFIFHRDHALGGLEVGDLRFGLAEI
jgi:hypothetical protein